MSDPSDIGSLSQISAAVPPGPASSSSAPRAPPDVITYSYASRMVYVAPGETYDHAIDIAKESFLELKDVEPQRINLEVHVVLRDHQQARRTAEIGRTAWPFVVPSLARFEIVEIRVAPETAIFRASAVEPPPYAPEKSGYWQPPSPPSLVTRMVNLLSPKSSRSRLSP
ncbi:hypothetical protein F5888DRAFT_1638548 [Russula emetica]|nr:hypothetical protein F5888DRAFT_1638548 [Russula emetica]